MTPRPATWPAARAAGRPAARGLVGRRRSRLAIVALMAVVALMALAFAAPARAGTFRVSQCGAVTDGAVSPRGHQAGLWTAEGGWLVADCGAAGGSLRLDTNYHRLAHTEDASARFGLPASMPDTSLRSAWLDWTSMPQSASDNPAFLHIHSGGAVVRQATTGDRAAGRVELPRGARDLRFQTWCSWAHGPGWCAWPGAMFELRAMTLELEERGEPGAVVSGALLTPGDHSGVEPLEILASDGDSGVRRLEVSLGARPVGGAEPSGACRDDRLPPCPQTLRSTVDVDTRAVADGTYRLRVVVTDAAGNARTLDPGTVTVRNRQPTAPVGAPLPAATPASPAAAPTPRAPARPATTRPFPQNPLDGRGHVRNGTHANARARIRAWLEPEGLRRATAVTVPPGVRVRIRGRLTDPRGRPIGRATLAAVRREPDGAWNAVTGVRTRPNGRFTTFSRIGPSQELRFVYYAYGDSLRGRSSRTLRVSVLRR